MQVRHKGLSIEFCPPPHPSRTPEFRAAFPLGKIPALELDDGTMIGESTAIMSYLERLFPQVPMVPNAPLECAHNDMMIRYVDNHLSMGLSPLFKEFFGLIHSGDAASANDERFELLFPELEKLDRLLNELPSYRERNLQTGDLCIASNLYYVRELCCYFGVDDVLSDYEQIRDWQDWSQQFPAVTAEVAVMDKSHQALIKSLSKTGEKL